MNRHTTSSFRQQAATLAVAAVMTLAVVGSLAGIADQQHANVLQASAAGSEPVVQQVVVIGQRAPRS
jgi:hypothetical protein